MGQTAADHGAGAPATSGDLSSGTADDGAAGAAPAAEAETATPPAAASGGRATSGGSTTKVAAGGGTAGAAATSASAPGSGGTAAVPGAPAPAPRVGGAAPTQRDSKSPIVLGHIGDYGGVVGTLLKGGDVTAQVVARYVNDNGGLDGHPIKVIVGNAGGDPARALSLARDMVENHRAVPFFGTLMVFSGYGRRGWRPSPPGRWPSSSVGCR